MGIKGIYKEIGPGKRLSLTKLAVQKLEESGRPLRIAIDISIWQFQAQAARGGSNPAVRTLFYRLLRLLSLPIQPIFVFDGPYKPVFKRNKRSGRGDGVATAMAKRLIRLFGSMVHDAPGEAEAECALLQQKGIVDAVLSEDVDTIMFGCTRTMRNWSSEGTKGNKSPTHVSMYDTQDLSQGASGLGREGMVLVALMSGGDYLPEGIPGAGVKLACEAARAGFGKALCKIKRSNMSELASWKEWFLFELRHNESGFFRTRHKALAIPDDFPNMEILRYYTHPVVSPAATLDRLREQSWDREIDVQGLRDFVRETFDWSYRLGAVKYIRVMAPCLLMRKLFQRGLGQERAHGNIDARRKGEGSLVRAITNRRTHLSTDSTPELRLSFIPTSIVGYNFEQEPDEVLEFGRDGLALNSDDEMEDVADEADGAGKSKAKKPFSPTAPDLMWVPETVARQGIPLMVEDWEEAQREKAAARSKPKTSRRKSKTGGMPAGAMDKFVKVTKNNVAQTPEANKTARPSMDLPASPAPAFIAPDDLPLSSPAGHSPQKSQSSRTSKASTTKSRSKKKDPEPRLTDANINPWTISGSPYTPRVTKLRSSAKAFDPILISSSPAAPSPLTNSFAPTPNPRSNTAEEDKPGPLTTNTACSRKRPPSASPIPSKDKDEAETCSSSSSRNITRQQSPTPAPREKPQRKLARTESLPFEPTPRRGLVRARTIAGETPLKSDSASDSECELPALDDMFPSRRDKMKVLRGNAFASEGLGLKKEEEEEEEGEEEEGPKNAAPHRMTKLFVPSQSEPGFFREVEVSVEEADAAVREAVAASARNGKRRGVWRLSDVSIVDLSAEQ
ncbi:hypothetical protein GGS21DRAFT_529381 [Xylaria nigripes]|nr:hypothetical protein GGS21DRAFT_529381 [Xylaria nigripes]